MIDARVRLIYNFGLTDAERLASRKGAAAFARFGVKIEEAVAGPEAGRFIRNGPLVSIMAGGSGLFELRESMFRPFRFSLTDSDTRMLVLGITPHPMHDGLAMRHAVGRAFAGAVVSNAVFRAEPGGPYRGLDQEAASLILERLVVHGIGLTFIEKECGSGACVMQRAEDALKFAETVARARLDFCDACAQVIRSSVTSIRYFGMA